ncbi:MAG: hypothetical protein ABL951_04110 [Alphaproteobacteria bacterium]
MSDNWFEKQKRALLDKTEDGLQIIARHVPDCDITKRNATAGTRMFKSPFRDEKTASCNLFYMSTTKCWGITDHGETNKATGKQQVTNAFECYMRIARRSQSQVGLALLELCMQFDVPRIDDGSGKTANKPFRQPQIDVVKKLDQHTTEWEYAESQWTDLHFNVFNPKATNGTDEGNEIHDKIKEAAELYGLVPVQSFTYCGKEKGDDGKFKWIKKSGTSVYPIFIWLNEHNGKRWAKTYEPYAAEKSKDDKWKGMRFMHLGEKPKDFVYGLSKLKKFHADKLKAQLEKLENEDADHKVIASTKKNFKLDEVIITTGGSDGVNVFSLGYFTVWNNSESAFLNGAQFAELRQYAHTIYYVGDLDKRGKEASYDLGMMYLDCHIIRLPESMQQYKGWREKAAKDVKDFCERYHASAFQKLVNTASPFKFWSYNPNSKAAIPYSFEPMWAMHFLHEHGFRKFENNAFKSGFQVVRVQGNIVTAFKNLDDVKSFLVAFVKERGMNKDIVNLIYRCKQMREEFIRDLAWFSGSFKRATNEYQLWFFPDCIWKITADKTEILKHGQTDVYCWSDIVYAIPGHESEKIELLPNKLKVEKGDDGQFTVSGIDYTNIWEQFVVNSTKMKWKEEFKMLGLPENATQSEVTKAGGNTLQGAKLDAQSRYDQLLHYLGRRSMKGYFLHTFKRRGSEWAGWVTENFERDARSAEGGTGKSMMFDGMRFHLLHSFWMDGQNLDEKFMFGGINKTHELVVIADADQHTKVKQFFNPITDGLTNRGMHTLGEEIGYKDLAKFLFLTNFMPHDPNGSVRRRTWMGGFSDYYHEEGGQHNETRKPSVDFGRRIYDEFTVQEWIEWYNWHRESLQLYLKFGRIDSPMSEMNRQINKVAMGQNFEAWANEYLPQWVNELQKDFIPSSDNCRDQKYLPVKVALHEYMNYLKTMRANREIVTQENFMRKLEAFAKFHGYTYNPVALRNRNNRLQKKMSAAIMQSIHDSNETKTITADNTKLVNGKGIITEIKWADDLVLKYDTVQDMIYLASYQDKLRISESDDANEVWTAPEDAF